MRPKIVQIFNQGEENYFKFKVEYKDNYEMEGILIEILEKLGFSPFERRFNVFNIKPYEEEFTKKTYKERIGLHKFFENDKFKIHVIFSEDGLNMIVKCGLEDKSILSKALEKFLDK